MLTLIQTVFAGVPGVDGTLDVVTVGDRTRLESAVHVGFDLSGFQPGVTGRFQLGHRFSVEGRLFAGLPWADRVSWTGGVSLGLEARAHRVELGSVGALDLHVGTGLTTRSNAFLKGLGVEPSIYARSTLAYTPVPRFSFYGGVLLDDVSQHPRVLPTVGVRFGLE